MVDVSNLISAAVQEPTAPEVSRPAPPLDAKIAALQTLPEEKQQAVEVASNDKRTAMGDTPSYDEIHEAAIGRVTGAGVASSSARGQDLSSMGFDEVAHKYGDETAGQLAEATQRYRGLLEGSRMPTDAAYDRFSGASLGVSDGLLGLGSIGLGAVDKVAGTHMGTWASKQIQDMNEQEQATQSPFLQNQRAAEAPKSALQARDNAFQYDKDIAAGDGNTLASLKQIGRSASDKIGNLIDNPTLMDDEISNAAGGLLAGGALAKGIGAIGSKASPLLESLGINEGNKGVALASAIDASAGNMSAARIAQAVGKVAPSSETLAGAGQFAGGSYQGTAAEISKMSKQDLEARFPDYVKMIAPVSEGGQGMDPDDARDTLANNAGLMAGGMGGVVGMGAGKLIKNVLRNPFPTGSLGEIGHNFAATTAEQALQGGATKFTDNVAKKAYDPKQDLTEGVGEGIGSGLVAGAGLGAGMAAPGLAVRGAAAAKDAAVRAIVKSVSKTKAENAQVSDVTDEALAKSGQDAQTAAQAPETKETLDDATVKAKAADTADTNHGAAMEAFTDKLLKLNTYNPKDVENSQLPDSLKEKLKGVTTRVELMQKLADVVNEQGPLTEDGRAAGLEVLHLHNEFQSLKNSDDSSFDAIPEGHAAHDLKTEFGKVYENISQSPKIVEALGKIAGMSDEDFAKLTPAVTDKASPENQQRANDIATLAETHPDRVDPDVISTLLEQADKKNVQLTPRQKAAVKAAQTLGEAKRATNDAQKASGRSTAVEDVANDIRSHGSKPELNGRGGTNPQRSVAAYWKEIHDYMGATVPDLVRAKAAMQGMRNFLEGMQNKSEAINQHYLDGKDADRRSYWARNPETDTPYEVKGEKQRVGVTADSAKSVDFAQTVHAETSHVSDAFNKLRETFPELGFDKTEVKPLHENLQGNPETVAKAHDGTDLQSKAAVTGAKSSAQLKVSDEEAAAQSLKDLGNQAADHLDTIHKMSPEELQKLPQDEFEYMRDTINEAQDHFNYHEDEQQETLHRINAETERRDAEANAPAESRVSPELAQKLSKDGLLARIKALDDNRDKTSEDDATLGVFKDEQKRHDEVLNKIAKPETVEESQPNLYGAKESDGSGKLTNMFHVAFKIAKDKLGEYSSRLLTSFDPYADALKALSSDSGFVNFTQGALHKGSIPNKVTDAWRAHLRDNVPQLRATIERALQAKLAEVNGGKTVAQRLIDGVDLNRAEELKLLNLIEQQPDGSFKFNKRLLDQALVAVMQWTVISDRFAGEVDAAGVTAIAGIPADLAANYVDLLNKGLSDKDALYSLSDMIKDYWGLNTDKDAPKNYPDGIAQSMAAELLSAMLKTGLMRKESNTFNDVEHGIPLSDKEAQKPRVFKDGVQVARTYRSADRYIVNLEKTHINERTGEEKQNPLFAMPTLLEEAILTNPSNKNFYSGDKIPVASHQMHSDMVENSDEDKRELARHNKVPYTLNEPTYNLYAQLGSYGMLEVFAAGDLEGRVLNDQHRAKLQGQNTTERTGWEAIASRVAEMRGMLDEDAEDELSDVVMHFAHNKSVIGRTQQLGGITPQGNKAMREAVSAYKSTVDLSTGSKTDQALANKLFWNRALAQGLGIDIHAMSDESIAQKLNSHLQYMSSTVEMMQAAHKGDYALDQAFIDQIKHDFQLVGIKDNAKHVAFNVLSEHARWLNASEKERANFTTHVYLEADGVTNGMVNSMHLFMPGDFTPNQIDNMKLGGWLPQGEKTDPSVPATMNERRIQAGGDGSAKDLYDKNSNGLKGLMDSDRADYAHAPQVQAQMDHVAKLLSRMLPGDISYDAGTGVLTIGRGLVKNPMTITLYGAGADGIAGKITTLMTKALYEKLSDALQKRADTPEMGMQEAMFGKGPTAKADAEAFLESFNALLGNSSKRGKDDINVVANDPKVVKPLTLDEMGNPSFKFDKDRFGSLTSNVKAFVVDPLQKSIEKTMGKQLLDAMKHVQNACQPMSIMMEHTFNDRVQEALAAKVGTEGYKKGDFLSQNELNEIKQKLLIDYPVIDTGHQRFLPVKSNQSESGGTAGSSLSGAFKTKIRVNGPADGGVIAQPMLNMGMGDGRMIQIMMNLFHSQGLATFDGFHFGLNDIQEGGRDANQAAFMAWREGNPARDTLNSFSTFLKALKADPSLLEKSPVVRAALAKSVAPDLRNPTPKQLLERLSKIEETLARNADQVDARSHALNGAKASIDTMAGPQTPYEHQGKSVLPGASSEEQARALNALKAAAPKGPVTAAPTPLGARGIKATTPVPQTTNPLLTSLLGKGHALASGVERFVQSSLAHISANMDLSLEQRKVWDSVLKSNGLDKYSVIVGSDEAIQSFQSSQSPSLPTRDLSKQAPLGYADPRNKKLYLIDPTMETMLHEAIHASTLQSVLAHYMGGELGPRAKQISHSIGRLETFMKQFLDEDFQHALTDADPEALQTKLETYQAAVDAIQEHLKAAEREGMPIDDVAEHKAIALNEFMAWSLANKDLSQAMKESTAAPSRMGALGRMSRAVWNEVKNIVFGARGTNMPELGHDMFSHVLFNAQVLMHEQPNTAELNRTVTAQHNRVYGDNERLAEADKTLDAILGRYLRPNGVQDMDRAKIDAKNRLNAGLTYHMVAAQGMGFKMTEQARGTFERIVIALSTNMRLDGNSLAAASELYTHVISKLTAKDLEDGTDTNPVTRKQIAENKLDVLLGVNTNDKSALLGVFLGLATVDDHFREVLRKIQLPKGERNTDDTLDALCGNVANGLLESMADKFAGVSKAENIKLAIDGLTNQIAKTADDSHTTLELMSMAPNATGNIVNEATVGWMRDMSERVLTKTDAVKADPNATELAKNVATGMSLIAKLASDKGTDALGESLLSLLNRGTAGRDWREAAVSLVGRTSLTAPIFDLIKPGKAMVSKNRQEFRDNLPKTLAKAFETPQTKEQMAHHYQAAKADIAGLVETHGTEKALHLLDDPRSRPVEIKKLEDFLKTTDPRHFSLVQEKARQLAGWMMGEGSGTHLLKNAHAVADLPGVKGVDPRRGNMKPDYHQAVDELVSLYAMNKLSPEVQKSLSSLVQKEPNGMNTLLNYQVALRKGETMKAEGEAYYNAGKGYVPRLNIEGASTIVAYDKQGPELLALSYIRIGDYTGSKAEGRNQKMGYYYAPVSGRARFEQGLLQNAAHTSGGVETSTGRSVLPNAGFILNRGLVARIAAGAMREGTVNENLVPVFNRSKGIIAYERALDPTKMEAAQQPAHITQSMGVWAGRQIEEDMGHQFNKLAVDATKEMWDQAIRDGRQNEFVDLNDPKSYGSDKIIEDAMRLAPPELKQYIYDTHGEKFMVRRDQVEDTIGARKATVGDFWTGNSRWSPETQNTVRDLAMSVYGNKAYAKLINFESMVHEGMQEAKNTILIRSIVVPVTEFMSNMLQLIRRGIAPMTMTKQMPRKIAECEVYERGRREIMEAGVHLQVAIGAKDILAQRRLNAVIAATNDRFKRLSIWPLIEAGELGSITETGVPHDETTRSYGQLHDIADKWVKQLPLAVQKAGRYAVITKDTALYQGLQKTVEYGDFLGKALYYDHLVQKKGMSSKDALAIISEEYVHYDRSNGRTQGVLNDMGLLWFMNFKLRTAKVALSMIRNNPVQCLVGAMMPMPHIEGIGTPLSDNGFTKLVNGKFWYSVGPQMAFRAPYMNPWVEGFGLLSGMGESLSRAAF